MTHPTEETLNDFIERELSPAEHVRIATHLESCGECALVVAEIQQVVRDASALGPLAPPPHVWSLIQDRLDATVEGVDGVQSPEPRAQSPEPSVDRRRMRFAWAAATAALVVMAFFTGRFVHQRDQQTASQRTAADVGRASTQDAEVRERVLLIAVGDHLERSQM